MKNYKQTKKRDITMSQKQIRDILYIQCGGYCPECGMKMHNKNSKELKTYMTVDHIIPKSKGGKRNIENLRPLCRQCNNERGNKPIQNLLGYKDYRGVWIVC